MLSALFSVTFALYAIKLREYFFMIGSKDNRKIDKILEEKQELFEKYLSEETYNTALKNFTSTYINYNEQNFKNNEKKADYITKSFYLMLTTIGLITLALILLFSSFMITIL